MARKVVRAAAPNPAEAERRRKYVLKVKSRAADERRRRLARLEAQSGDVQHSIRKIRALSDSADHPPIRLRKPFVELPYAREVREVDPDRDVRKASTHAAMQRAARETDIATRPPMTRLVRSSRALKLELTVVLAATCSAPPGGAFSNNRPLTHRDHGWAALTADRSASPRERRRHLQRALSELDRWNLVQLGKPSSHGRYDRFEFRTEDGSDTTYTVPGERSNVVELPAGLFLNGWHLVLTPAEIATWIMYWVRAQRSELKEEHDEKGLFAVETLRWSVYGITDEVYEAHNELEEFGLLIDAAPDDRLLGRAPEKRDEEGNPKPREARRFRVDGRAFDREALDVIRHQLATYEHPKHLR